MGFILLLILGCVIYLVVNWQSATKFQEIAKMKGHYDDVYFWWCFWLGLYGWAMVIALPDRRGSHTETILTNDDLPAL